MKKLFLLTSMLCISFIINAQLKIDEENMTTADGIPVFQGQMQIKNEGRKFSFAFAQGDKVQIKLSTEKDKNIKYANLRSISGTKVWSKEDVSEIDETIGISREGVYILEVVGKGLGGRMVTLELIKKPGSQMDFNPAWMKYSTYHSNEVEYNVDSVIGYNPPVVSQKLIKVFDQYLYQNVEMFNLSTQILGQAGIHNSQAKGYGMGIDPTKIPRNGKFKGYSYSLSSVLGGAKHWVIADITVSVGAMFLSPAAGFAAHGAMAIIGPQPGNEPVMYYVSNRKSDIDVVKEIYRPYNDGRKITNAYKEGLGNVVGLVSGKAKDAVKGTKVHVKNEGELDFDQKGKVTNLLMYSATAPENNWFIMANPEYTQAKNVKMKGSAIYYAPTYKNVPAKEYMYTLKTVPVKKTASEYSKSVVFGSIKK
ncbi:MAG: hypothetical protein P1P88_06535 [Bacteroidales bacterium]|nr:hypothetical protein [Bacteroidales bacterium]